MGRKFNLEYIRNDLIEKYKYYKRNAIKFKTRQDSRSKERYAFYNGNANGLFIALELLGVEKNDIIL